MSKRELDGEDGKGKRPKKDENEMAVSGECSVQQGAMLQGPGRTSLVIDIEKVKADITKVEKDVANVEQRIAEVKEQIKTASEKAFEVLQGSNTPPFEYWRKEEDYLRKEEDYLRKKKDYLRKKEEDLRARLAAKERTDSRPVMSLSEPIKIKMDWDVPLLLEREDATKIFDTYLGRFFHGDRAVDDLCWSEKGARHLTTVGIMGTGKTTFIKAMANRVNEAGYLGIVVSYSERGTTPIPLRDDEEEFVNRFVAQLLRYNEYPEADVDEVRPPSLDELVKALRGNYKDRVDNGIVIFIDELVIHVGPRPDPAEVEMNQMAEYTVKLQKIQKLNSKLMAASDKGIGEAGTKVMFVFTALTHAFCDSLTPSMSGRRPAPLPLCNLSPEGAWEALGDAASARVKSDKGLLQLFLSCAGHPRLIALLRAKWGTASGSDRMSDCDLIRTRHEIARDLKSKAKLRLPSDLGDTWVRWFRDEIKEDEKCRLRESGILQPLKAGEQLLPMLVHLWEPHAKHQLLHHHLVQAYNADAVLHEFHEKDFEDVMMNWEAVKKIILLDKPVSLDKLFKGGFLSKDVAKKKVTVRIPETRTLIQKVANFDADVDREEIKEWLSEGYTVVSEKSGEEGIEYLSPYFVGKELYVALVQCKFVENETASWKTLREKIQSSPAKKLLNNAGIASFMVFFTTVNRRMLQEQTVTDGVYFTEDSLFTFTQKLGILRMHTEKTGDVLERRSTFGEMTG